MTQQSTLRILVVDDEKPSTALFSEILKDQGYDFQCINSPEEAIVIAKTYEPDIIISDISMPDMDGYRFQEMVRRVLKDKEIGFVYVSAFSRGEDKVRGLDAGADDYITKPFDIAEFIARLRRLADQVLKRRAMMQNEQSLKGSLEEISLSELIQILNQSKRSGILRIEAPVGNGTFAQSKILIEKGEVIDARSESLEGEVAFCNMLFIKKGKFGFESQKTENTDEVRTITRRANQLLLDGTKFVDDYDAIVRSKPTAKVKNPKGISDTELLLLTLCDGNMSIDALVKKHGLHPFKAAFAAKTLEEKGFIDLGIDSGDVINVDKLFAGIEAPTTAKAQTYKVLVVDDSNMIRKAIVNALKADPAFEQVEEATNGREGIEKVASFDPDIVTLDINMPIMDGLSALKHIMVLHPRPVVMISTLTREGAETSFEAMKLGALDVICKPTNSDPSSFMQQKQELVEKVKRAARVQRSGLKRVRGLQGRRKYEDKTQAKRIIVIGAEKGGYGGVIKIVSNLPGNLNAAVIVVQYMPDEFRQPFADFLSTVSEVSVCTAESGIVPQTGTCYISNHSHYLSFDAGRLQVSAKQFQFDHQRSIDICMFGASEQYDDQTMGVILSGEADDGIEGMREIQRVGGRIYVCEPTYNLYPAMAESVIKSGIVETSFSIEKIIEKIIKYES